MKKQEFGKNEEMLRNLQDILKHFNIWIIEVPEREEEEQKFENLFEQIMKKNFPHLVKEIDFQEVQEPQRVPKKLDSRKHTPKHIIITLAKIKDNGGNLKSSKRKGDSYLQMSARKTISWFLKRNLSGKKGLERSIRRHDR